MAYPNIPVGAMKAYAGDTAPAGYLICNGASLLRADYPELFSVLGTKYGSADGTHFNIPNAEGRILVGKYASIADFDDLGKTGGAKTLDLSHTHTIADHTHSGSGNTGNAPQNSNMTGNSGSNVAAAAHYHSFSLTISTVSNNTMDTQGSPAQIILNPYIILNWIIKV